MLDLGKLVGLGSVSGSQSCLHIGNTGASFYPQRVRLKCSGVCLDIRSFESHPGDSNVHPALRPTGLGCEEGRCSRKVYNLNQDPEARGCGSL